MKNRFFMPSEVSNKLVELIKKEDYKGSNFNSPRSLSKATEMLIHEVPTPYKASIEPLLETLVKNPLKEEVKLDEDKVLASGEMISWLDLVKLKFSI